MAWFATFLLLHGCATAAPAPRRVVAVGDLHGDADNALAVLKLAGVADDRGNWVGGDAVLVQTGDVVDRGPDSKQVMDLLRGLRASAAKKGGTVVLLLGNHEAMNLQGDWRYVDPGDVEAFGGLDARKAAFAPGGEYATFLGALDVVAKVDDTVFVHGGVLPAWAERGVDGINAAAREALRAGDGTVLRDGGPLWARDFVNLEESEACPVLSESLAALGARRMVVGHTTRRNGRIEVRCGGRLAVIDTGIADGYGGNVAVWEMVDGDARAVYPGSTLDLEDPR